VAWVPLHACIACVAGFVLAAIIAARSTPTAARFACGCECLVIGDIGDRRRGRRSGRWCGYCFCAESYGFVLKTPGNIGGAAGGRASGAAIVSAVNPTDSSSKRRGISEVRGEACPVVITLRYLPLLVYFYWHGFCYGFSFVHQQVSVLYL
jgi:hypothetical protein